MVTIKEVMQHVKEEKGAGSDRYEKLYDYFTKFSPMELAYLETEGKRLTDEYKMPRSWNAITSMLSILALLVAIFAEKLSVIDNDSVIRIGIVVFFLIVLFAIMDIRRIRCLHKSNKLIEILEIVKQIQKVNNSKTKSD